MKHEYVISTSFDKADAGKWWLSGYAKSITDFISNEFLEGYEIYLNKLFDEAVVKYDDGGAYFVFRIN